MSHTITLLPGDGIGPEVAQATVDVLQRLDVDIQWDTQPIGLCGVQTCGQALPEATLQSIIKNTVALKGPTTTPIGGGHISANVQLRRRLDLYASVRPIKTVPGVASPYTGIDLVIFRENTEGLYAGLEHEVAPGVVVSMKVVTDKATRRIAEAAFAYASKHGRKRVTVVHKANILKLGDGSFLKIAQEVAKQYPHITCDDAIVDSLCMRLVRNPAQFDVLVMENLYGDIISDLGAGLVGGLGVVPGANMGRQIAVFEAVHGAAPDIAGRGLANPTALLKSAMLMLAHLGELDAANRLSTAVDKVLAAGSVRTGDLGGTSTTKQYAEALIEAL